MKWEWRKERENGSLGANSEIARGSDDDHQAALQWGDADWNSSFLSAMAGGAYFVSRT